MEDYELTGCPADVDAVVAVGGMAQDPFVLFVERIHGVPGECNACLQLARVRGQVDVSPCSSGRAVLACLDGIPGCEPKIGMVARMFGPLENVWRYVSLREVGHRIAAGLEEQEDILAIGDPGPPETHAHPPTQRLNVQQALGYRIGHEKPADRSQ